MTRAGNRNETADAGRRLHSAAPPRTDGLLGHLEVGLHDRETAELASLTDRLAMCVKRRAVGSTADLGNSRTNRQSRHGDQIRFGTLGIPVQDRRIVAHRGEFIDAMRLLRVGHLLVPASDGGPSCMLDGGYRSLFIPEAQRLCADRCIDNSAGFPGLRHYRISDGGRAFAAQACARWQ